MTALKYVAPTNVFCTRDKVGIWDFHRQGFIVKLSLTAHLRDISILLYRLIVKGINRTFKDIHSSYINFVFCGFRINAKNVALHKYTFFIGVMISMTSAL